MNTDSVNDTPQLQTLSRAAFWPRHIEQWRASGLSKMAYCQQYALTYHQMTCWSNKDLQVVKPEEPSSGFIPMLLPVLLPH